LRTRPLSLTGFGVCIARQHNSLFFIFTFSQIYKNK
jgi:hypothetical protein